MCRILVVDDIRHVRRAIGGWLKRCGFRVAIADGNSNGPTALDDSSFDLMIVNILMPNMRGFEPVRLSHQREPAVSLTAISGSAFAGTEADNPACVKMALSLGATRCLCKPFRPATLLGMIDQCLSEAEPHRSHTAALAAIAVSEKRSGTAVSGIERVVTG